MLSAFYMDFVEGHHHARDRIGGLPSHVPPKFPVSNSSGNQMAFLAQFYCDGPRLILPGTLCIQLYQDLDVDAGGEVVPVAVRVPTNSPLNQRQEGVRQSCPRAFDIAWIEKTDPETEPEFPEDLPLYASKIGGLCLHIDAVPSDEKFLLQLKEQPGELNFAGRTCLVCTTMQGDLRVYLS